MTLRQFTIPVLIIFLLSSSLTIVGRAAVSQKQTPQGNQWPTKYEDGTEAVEKGTKMKVTVGKERIICEAGKRAPFSILVATVTEVSYDTKSRRRWAEAGAVAAASLGVALVFMALKTTKHFVNILWEENGARKEVIFKVGKGEYVSFLAELQRVTGKEWKNLVMERKRVQEELKREQEALKREKDKRMSVQLDRVVRVGVADLKPGLYQLVLLERQENKGELYFFAGKEVDTKKIAAAALVEIMTPVSDGAAAPVLYKDGGGIATISEIRMPAKTFRFL
jgi:hypothetical protein